MQAYKGGGVKDGAKQETKTYKEKNVFIWYININSTLLILVLRLYPNKNSTPTNSNNKKINCHRLHTVHTEVLY